MLEWLRRRRASSAALQDTAGELEKRLKAANKRLSSAVSGLTNGRGTDFDIAFQSAFQDVLKLERQLAAAKGEQYAEPLDFPVNWDTGAPLPQLLVNDYRAAGLPDQRTRSALGRVLRRGERSGERAGRSLGARRV